MTVPLLQVTKFDLVVSGINRGDNLGLHVMYSGTVGAAREAACKVGPSDVPPCSVLQGAHDASGHLLCLCTLHSAARSMRQPSTHSRTSHHNWAAHVQGVPAVAVSLDNYKALTPEAFEAAAAYTVAIVKVM